MFTAAWVELLWLHNSFRALKNFEMKFSHIFLIFEKYKPNTISIHFKFCKTDAALDRDNAPAPHARPCNCHSFHYGGRSSFYQVFPFRQCPVNTPIVILTKVLFLRREDFAIFSWNSSQICLVTLHVVSPQMDLLQKFDLSGDFSRKIYMKICMFTLI